MLSYLKEFGVKVFVAKSLAKIFKTNFFYKLKHKTILNYLRKDCSKVIDKYKDYVNEENSKENNIYVFWYQGIDTAPMLIKKCVNSIKKHSKMNVIVITKDNYKEYTDIDNSIIEKLENKEITYTFFSDILRFNLLKNHGGLWLDATIFASSDFNIDGDFFTIKKRIENNKFVSEGKWTSYAIGGNKENLIFHFMNDLFKDYLSRRSILIDYYLVDYALELAYTSFDSAKNDIDSVSDNNENVYELISVINENYDKHKYEEIVDNTYFHKLTYKCEFDLDNKESYYHMIISEKL